MESGKQKVVEMATNTFKGVVDNIQPKCQAGLDEMRSAFEETMQWLSDICGEIDKHTSQRSVLLPKTPTAKRKLRKKCPVETIPEHSELDIACPSQNVVSPSTSIDTRITRSTRARSVNQSLEVISPVLNRRSKRQASKAADAKIKDQLNMTLNAKMRQAADMGSSRETRKKKHVSSHATIDEDERLCKSRRLEQEHSVLPPDEQHENRSIIKAEEINSRSPLVRNMAKLGSSPLAKERSVSSVIIETCNNIRNNEEEMMYSPGHGTSSVHDDCLTIQEERQKSLTDSAPVASAATETHDDFPGVPDGVSLKLSEGVRPSNSVCVSCVHEVDSVTYDETHTNECRIHSPPDAVSDINESNKTAPKSVLVLTEGESEHFSSGTKNVVEEVHESAIKQIASEKEVSVDEVGKTGPNITCTETSQNSGICAKVGDQNGANDVAPKQCVTSHSTPALQSSPKKNMVKLQKSTHLLRPFACEPVQEWKTAFEKLHTVSEESAEQIVAKEPEQTMRITRTKTRAMSKVAAAVAAATSQEVGDISTDLPKNVHSQNTWRAARKSLARAKKISLAKESRELDKTDEQEMSKENSMTSIAGLKFTTPHGLHYYEKYKKTPLSANNISYTTAHSGSRVFAVSSSSKRHFLTKKQVGNIVVGVDSFITKQTIKPALEEIREKKEEGMKRRIEKEEEARKKREQKVKEKAEETRRKREEKMLKVLKTREAIEKQKQDAELRMQEKEEKMKQVMQYREDKMKEHVQQKKQHAQKKAAETEERRKQEEAARLAKLKEQEEEQRRLEAERKKEQEEAERQYLERSAVEKEAARLREQQTAMMAQMQAKLVKEKQTNERTETEVKAAPSRAAVLDRTFNMPPPSSSSGGHNPPKKMVNLDNYGIDSSGESSEDEERPKRPIPQWARKAERLNALKNQAWISKELVDTYITCEEKTPNLMKMFGGVRCVKRTSSAVWRTPPRFSSLRKY